MTELIVLLCLSLVVGEIGYAMGRKRGHREGVTQGRGDMVRETMAYMDEQESKRK